MVSTCSRILHCHFWAFQSSFSLIAGQFEALEYVQHKYCVQQRRSC